MLSTWVRRLIFKVLVGENLFLALHSGTLARMSEPTLGPAAGQNTHTKRITNFDAGTSSIGGEGNEPWIYELYAVSAGGAS
jgi:hypothetical protein